MINSNFKTAFRSIIRNNVQSVISILGLGIGLGCIILLLALILHETSFNRFIPDHSNLFRIVLGNSGITYYPLAEEMKREFPEVKDFFRYYQTNNIQLRNKRNEVVRDQNFGFSDPSIYKIIGIKLISGVPAIAINEVAISEKIAMKYFGTLSPLGEVIPVKLNDSFLDLVVTGVYNAFPSSSTLYPDFIANTDLSEKMFGQFQRSLGIYGNDSLSGLDWRYNEFLSFVLLDKNAGKEALSGKMEKYKELINNEAIKDLKFSFQPVSEIYLKSGEIGGVPFLRTGNANELKYYEAISLLILLISVINYILLTRAGTSFRLKELGTRKAFGASRKTLRNQIILESNLVAVLSLIPAAFMIDLGITFINNTLNKTLSNEVFHSPIMWFLIVLVIIFTGTISGLLIGYNFSRIPAIQLLSGKSSTNSRRGRWAYSFLLFHFSIYMILVAGAITVSKQIRYSLSGYKGINPRDILVSDLNTDELKKSFSAICDEIEKIPGVIRTAGGSYIPPFGNYLPVNLATPEGEKVRFDGLIMGEGMTELLGIEVKEGESFGELRPNSGVLINESSALKHNLKAGDIFLGFNIRGIVKDFNAHSLHTLIEPMVILQQNPDRMGLIAIKTDRTNDAAIIKRLKELYNQISPDEIFEVSYLTDQVTDFYSRERNHANIIGAFSLLATVLSMMGLFGLALISISKRTKEIGIRKVSGSSVFEVLYLLNIDFIRWIVVAIVVSVPVSVYIMTVWLKRFAYKTELSWWIFASAGMSAIIIALLTVSWQSLRAAMRNPVEALRYE
jgi:putative ABC transport system permease protein